MAKFPTAEWLQALMDKLNTDDRYAQVARNWEGDMLFEIQPNEALMEEVVIYLDLWHGKCRQAYLVSDGAPRKAVFTLRGAYGNYVRLLKGQIDPMQALLTRKLNVQGNMAILMRNVPTVIDFVRCCKEVTTSVV